MSSVSFRAIGISKDLAQTQAHILYFSSVFFKRRKCHTAKAFTLFWTNQIGSRKNDRCSQSCSSVSPEQTTWVRVTGRAASLCFLSPWNTSFTLTDARENWCRNSVHSWLFLIPAFCFVTVIKFKKIKCQCWIIYFSTSYFRAHACVVISSFTPGSCTLVTRASLVHQVSKTTLFKRQVAEKGGDSLVTSEPFGVIPSCSRCQVNGHPHCCCPET